jgi:murein DD-endopeptidase MepM/ murein hydrolase activator NlpD
LKGRVVRAALLIAAAAIAWYALRRTPPSASKPAELLGEAPRAVLPVIVWHSPDTLNIGETLAKILVRGGVSDAVARDIVAAAAPYQDPRRMPVGMTVQFVGDTGAPAPSEVILRLAVDRRLHIARGADSVWRATEEKLPWTIDTVVVRGAVSSSLYDAFSPASNALFPGDSHNELVIRVADVYQYRVDMSRELWQGDSVYVVVQRRRGPENITHADNILATRLINHGRTIEGFVFFDSLQHAKYYDLIGKSLATRFLRSPIEFARISSHFNPSRFHPILKTWRAHKGTDYAASAGTPIRVIADGRVIRANYNPGGYGNVVDVDHGNVVTRYGHMRAFAEGIRPGVRVTQAQTIGYVGMTGLATAPHLHFEILKDGVQVNPEKEFSKAEGTPLPPSAMPAFTGVRDRLLTMLARPEGVVQPATPGGKAAQKGRGKS